MNNNNVEISPLEILRLVEDQKFFVSQLLVEVTQDWYEAIFLSILVWNSLHNEKVIENDGWFYYSAKQWDRLHFSEWIRRRIQKSLIEKDIIEMDRRGVPPRNYYKIKLDNLVKLILSKSEETSASNLMKPKIWEFNSEETSELIPRNSHKLHIKEKIKRRKEAPQKKNKLDSVLAMKKITNFMPSKDFLIEETGMSEFKAKDILKEFKSLDFKERRKRLEDLLENGYTRKSKYKNKVCNEKKREIIHEVSLSDELQRELEMIQDLWQGQTGRRPSITSENKHEYAITRKEYRFEDVLYVARNCSAIVRTTGNDFFAISFDQLMYSKTIRRFLHHQKLADQEKSY